MLNDRMMTRAVMLVALAVLPSLASSQASQSSQAKAPDWFGKEVTQITIDGSSEQLKAFHEELQKTFLKSGLEDKTIYQSPVSKKKLAYWYLTETEKKFGESTVSGFYSALQGSTEKTKAGPKPPVMHTSVFLAFACRPKSCGGQLLLSPRPPCDC
jgi:hypothetical protein